MSDQLLERVTVQVESSVDGFEVVHYVPCSVIKCNDTGTTYTLVRLPDDGCNVTGTLACVLKYTVKDCDPATGQPDDDEGYPDEFMVRTLFWSFFLMMKHKKYVFQLEDVEVTASDHVQKVLKANWSASWEEIGAGNELEDIYTLPIATLEGNIIF